MRKKIFMLVLIVFTFIFSKDVLAFELVMDYQNNPYYYRVWSDKVDSGKLTFYNLDGEVTYCVEPGVHITDSSYIEIPFNTLGVNENILKKIKLIGYYGYEYPNHQTPNYRMATQALIWESLQNVEVSYWTGKNKTGNYVNIDNEKNEIMKLVNNHYVVPNISNDLTLSLKNDNILYDSNNVLNNYDIINDNSNLEVYINNNELHVVSNTIGDYEITLKKRKYDNKTTILYTGSDGVSQKLMKLRVDDNVELKINIHIVGGKLFLKKLNKDTENNNSPGITNLKDAVYGIYDLNNNLIEELITNEFGEVTSNYLSFGNYYLKEILPSYGYLLDENKYDFIINNNNLEKEINVLEELIKKELKIIKTLEGNYNILLPEKDIMFEIYSLDDNKLLDTIITDKDGIASIYLSYGHYRIHQVNTTKGYLNCEDFNIIVDEKTDKIVKVLNDKRIRGQLKIIKKDIDTNERLKGAMIEVYKDNQKIYSGYSDINGEILLKDLLVGKYKIIEKIAPNNYILDEKEYLIEIKDSEEIVFELLNKHQEIIVPFTSIDQSLTLKYSGLITLFLGFLFILIRKKI